MKVLYDITTLGHIYCAQGVQPAGIYKHTEAMGKALARSGEIDLYLCSSASQFRNALRYNEETKNFSADQFLLPQLASKENNGTLFSQAHRQSFAGSLIQSSVQQFHAQNYAPEYIYNPGKFDIYHVNWRGEHTLPTETHPSVVLTVYDVIALKHPEWFVKPGERNTIGEYLTQLLNSVRACHTITVSTESVKADLLSLFQHLSSEQIHVTPLGVSPRFQPCEDLAEIKAVKEKYEIPQDRRYILCVNTLEPRKNMKVVIEAYSKLVRENKVDDICLVLVGSKGWLHEDITKKADEFQANERSPTIVTGYVADSDLPVLYSGASAFCYPSFDEGFGLPILEAMSCGVPVITSNRDPLVEVAGDCAVFVDPNNAVDLAEAIYALLTDDHRITMLKQRGLERARNYTWKHSANKMVTVYNRVVSSRNYRKETSNMTKHNSHRAEEDISICENNSIKTLKNKHCGERAFILFDIDDVSNLHLRQMKDENVIVFNDFYKNYNGINWKPDIHVIECSNLSSDVAREINGLTGSTFLFEEHHQDVLRTGDDIIYFKHSASPSSPSDNDMFSYDASNGVRGPRSGIGAAIQLAYYMGFDPIYLVGSGAGDLDTKAGGWHKQCRVAIERAGRRIFNTSMTNLPTIYQHRSLHQIFATGAFLDYDRDKHATLDETQIISVLLEHGIGRQRTMIDVGAHHGHSTKHFVNKDWDIYCFEPDVDNRESFLVKKFGRHPNVTIDPRAVSDKRGKQVPFFVSEESSGVSGLLAFLDSHKQSNFVDVTTIADIMVKYNINEIDFLKIDVEGYDFNILKGIPWDKIMPDCIECEFEDAKTNLLGHTWRDICDYLVERGYTVYVSEWHPIIRYGIAHDWHTMKKYPCTLTDENAWGNLLAFKKDPGEAAIMEAIKQVIKMHNPNGKIDLMAAQATPAINVAKTPLLSNSKPVQRPFYANISDKLRKKATAIFRIGQVGMWGLRFIKRHLSLSIVGFSILAVLVLAPFVSINLKPYLAYLWTLAGLLAFAGITIIGASYANLMVNRTAARETLAREQVKQELLALLQDASSKQTEKLNALQQKTDERLEQSLEAMNDLKGALVGTGKSLNKVTAENEKTQRSLEEYQAKLTETKNDIVEFQHFNRKFTRKHVELIKNNWIKPLNLIETPSSLAYMANRILYIENQLRGRIATTIEDVVLRTLVSASVKGNTLSVLEIGTLFGIGVGVIYDHLYKNYDNIHLTIIDPLDGYYGESRPDIATRQKVTRETLIDNFTDLKITNNNYTLYQGFSTEDDIIEATSKNKYDVLIIDGDHSYAGVKTDFVNYAPFVKRGGYIIVDDYGTNDWPEIQKYVDDELLPREDISLVGSSWRTAVFSVIKKVKT